MVNLDELKVWKKYIFIFLKFDQSEVPDQKYFFSLNINILKLGW